MSIQDIGNNIRRYMKLQGFTISNLASRMGIGTATLSNVLNGKSEPKSSTLIKFSDALSVTLNDLLCEAPSLKSFRFRTSKILSAREKAERDQVLNSTAHWLKDYKELEEMLGEKKEYLFQDIKPGDPVKIANEVRERIDFKNKKEPVYDIADCIEKAGIKLRIFNFGFKKTFGLSVSAEDFGPAIIVNSEPSLSFERQIFTVVHELGHLLLHLDSYKISSEKDENEKYKIQEDEANSFAGHFLLPDEALKSEWEEAKGKYWVDAVLKIKKIYKVSYLTVLVRLCQVIQSMNLPEMIKRFSQDYKQKYNHDLKNHFEPDAIEYPVADKDPDSLSKFDLIEDRYAKLIRMAYEKKLITMSRAGELLKKSIMEMRELVKSWQEIAINA